MSLADQWALLGIAPTDDRREIKRAYVRALKAIDVDRDPAAFIALRGALDDALSWGTATPFWEEDDWDDAAAADGGAPAADDLVEAAEDGEIVEDDWFEQWRPALPAAGEAEIDRICAELDTLLFGDGDADPARVAALGAALLADPGLENVDRLNGVEQWLIQAIAAAPPRSDPLIQPAAARFGWDQANRHWRRDYNLENIVQRRRDLKFLAACRDERHLHHRALVELTRPPPAKIGLADLHIARDVGSFLDLIDRDHPSLHHDIEPETLAWWRDYFHRRHLPGDLWSILIIGTLALSLIAAVLFASRKADPLLALLISPVAAGVTFGTVFLVADLRARLRERAERHWTDARAPVAALWIAYAGLAMPLAAALMPAAAWSGWAAAGCALILFAAAVWSAFAHPYLAGHPPRTRLPPIVAVLVSMQMIVILPDEATTRLLPPLLALAWIGDLCADAAELRLRSMDRTRRVVTILASLLLALTAAVLLAADSVHWSPSDLKLAMVPVAIVAVHLATSASLVDVHFLEWPLRLAALLLYLSSGMFVQQFGQGLLLALAFYGLGNAALRAVFALHEEARKIAASPGA